MEDSDSFSVGAPFLLVQLNSIKFRAASLNWALAVLLGWWVGGKLFQAKVSQPGFAPCNYFIYVKFLIGMKCFSGFQKSEVCKYSQLFGASLA